MSCDHIELQPSAPLRRAHARGANQSEHSGRSRRPPCMSPSGESKSYFVAHNYRPKLCRIVQVCGIGPTILESSYLAHHRTHLHIIPFLLSAPRSTRGSSIGCDKLRANTIHNYTANPNGSVQRSCYPNDLCSNVYVFIIATSNIIQVALSFRSYNDLSAQYRDFRVQ